MFDRVGEITYPAAAGTPDDMLEAALEAGADDCQSDDEDHRFYCAAGTLHEVVGALEEKLGEPRTAQITWRPQNTIDIDDEKAESLLKMLDALEESDDVQNVFANYDISEDVMARLGG
jgi:transcriptional/translational regulatory protein YebC/TACO1